MRTALIEIKPAQNVSFRFRIDWDQFYNLFHHYNDSFEPAFAAYVRSYLTESQEKKWKRIVGDGKYTFSIIAK